ncbi:unnamed protein product [Euphydryas editha]|uniref:Uncharacterized protein n=1 Tax=Euphydryas editha TaxID=104508 RepID=A0AAU9UI16_EUPED|nr:unnamed protein product [Euphydryas editha]
MPRRKTITNYRNMQPRYVKNTDMSIKKNSFFVKTRKEPLLDKSTDDEKHDQNKENIIEAVAQLHTKEASTMDLAHEETIFRSSNVASLSDSMIIEEIIVRTSHDPDDNINIEEIALPDSKQPLDTSTPLGSPSISTIMQNVESETLNSFNINTPTSSMCATPLNNDTYTPSSLGDTTDKDVSNAEERQTKKKRKVKKKNDLGKIRKVNKSEWVDSKRKQLKNLGLCYVSRNGKVRSEKSILPACDDECRLKCKEKIDEDVRKQLFKQYWSLGDRVRQWDFLTRWCERIAKKRITTEGPSKRLFSVKYYLPKTLGDIKDERVTVCKTMFLHTFAIGEGVVRTALKKITDCKGLAIAWDERGRHNNHPKVKNDDMIQSVCNHVKSLTPVESHYTRKESSKLYLDSELTMTKMFKLYNEWVPETDSNKAKTLRQYIDIINDNFNIEFYRPKKDQCDICMAYKNQPSQLIEMFKNSLMNICKIRTWYEVSKIQINFQLSTHRVRP